MRVMVFAKATEDSEKGAPPTAEAFEAMDRFTEELVKAGVFVAAAGLKNTAEAKRITADGADRAIIDGPFAEARELVAGFSIWRSRIWTRPWPGRSAAPIPCQARARSRSGRSSRRRIWPSF